MKKLVIASVIISLFWALVFIGFVFDDLYISCRYAYNLSCGHGLVFNAGEQVEGYTNFLWTLICVIFLKIPVDPGITLKILSIILGWLCCLILIVTSNHIWKNNKKSTVVILLLLTSPYFVVWVQPGMETSLFTLFGLLALLCLINNKILWSLLSCSFACLTRPEGYIFFAAVIVSLCINHRKKTWLILLRNIWLPLLILVIYHLWRLDYYGDIFPNTYYVKMSGGLTRVAALAPMIPVGLGLGGLFIFYFFAFVNKTRSIPIVFSITVSWLFLIYAVTGTPDFFTTYRLLTPAIPFVLIAGVDWIDIGSKKSKIFLIILSSINLITIAVIAVFFTQMKPSLERSHGKIAEILNEQAKPGEVVLSQEMGLIPFRNPQLYFYDVIGLVTEQVSKKLYDEGVNPYTMYYLSFTEQGRKKVVRVKQEMRNMFFAADPDWIIVVAYPDWEMGGELEQSYDQEQGQNTLIRYAEGNSFFYNMMSDPRFKERYKLYGIYPAFRIYFLLLYKKI